MKLRPFTKHVISAAVLIIACTYVASADIIGVRRGDGYLVSVDPVTGSVTDLQATSPALPTVFGACSSSDPGKIWATVAENLAVGGTKLYEITVSTGVTSLKAAFWGDTGVINELAFDVGTGTMYGTDNEHLYVVDPATGSTSLVGSFGSPATPINQMFAMTFVPGYGLYGIDGFTKSLYSINTTNGTAVSVGPTGLYGTSRTFTDVAWDSSSFSLVGMASNTAAVYRIDLNNGSAVLLNQTSVPFVSGLADTSAAPTDLAISGGAAARVNSGHDLHYGIEVVNLGPNPASGVVLRAIFPSGVVPLDAKPSQGSCSQAGNTLACNVGSLATTQAFSLAISVQVTVPSGAVLDTAFGVFSSGQDPNMTNNVLSRSTVVK